MGPHMHAHAAQSHAHANATLEKSLNSIAAHARTCHTVRCTVECTVWKNSESINAHARTCRRVEYSEKEGGTNEEENCQRRDE